eukprot:CAMPEP_0174853884 /NCGR_PEP_ID=MMETSP1114-20130205/29621_1 /TAXON_ID=312471 /ORGANISM="Neobodo designis, Strain CCAP 1951/1" /LENGTH=387 /DNA_ID=CAMNT_0016088551 /DNA_START=26 /DNA_END=1186 /DNA_ORIENTATION=-
MASCNIQNTCVTVPAGIPPVEILAKMGLSNDDLIEALDVRRATDTERVISVVPQVGGAPSFPCGPRRSCEEHAFALAAVCAPDFFGDFDSAVHCPPRRVVTPMYRLRDLVELEVQNATAEMETVQDGVNAIDSTYLDAASTSVRNSVPRAAPQTCRLAGAAAAGLSVRHRYSDAAPTALRHATRSHDFAVPSQLEIELEVSDRFSFSRVAERWVVLGSHTVADALECFDCASDALPQPRVGGDFLYLGGVFAVAGGDAPPEDAVQHILDWEVSGSRPFRRCDVSRAASTTLATMKLRLGDRGVWRHCGNCDHVVTVTRISLVSASKHPERYPYRSHFGTRSTARCDVCGTMPASILTYFDPLAPAHPAMYCVPCFRHLHGTDALQPG